MAGMASLTCRTKRSMYQCRQQALHSSQQQSLRGQRLQTGFVSNGWRTTAATWLENNAQVDVDVPLELAWSLWEDREQIPQWMPWIQSVRVLPEDNRLSRWTLATEQFGQTWELSWVSLNLAPIKNQKIHWRSVDGTMGGSAGRSLDVANRGQIRFYRKSAESCTVKLTISYEVPGPLAPFAGALTPLVESILRTDLGRFRNLAMQRMAQQKNARV